MGFPGKSKSSSEGWGLGLLLVFFPDDDTVLNKKNNPFSSTTTTFRTTHSNLLTRAQSTISICVLILFITLLLFTLCTFEPTTHHHHPSSLPIHLSQPSPTPHHKWFTNLFHNNNNNNNNSSSPYPIALQGMGRLFRRGTRAMNDLVVCHLTEGVIQDDLRLFLRLLFRSGLTSRSDVALIFPSTTTHTSPSFGSVIHEENESFMKLVRRELNGTSVKRVSDFDPTHFVKSRKKESEGGEPLWGRRIRSNYSNLGGENELTQLSYGSVVGFEAAELDPENSLSGFLDHVPMSLRRWACYSMLLGRVRRNFKHIMLVDVKDVVVVGDPLVRVRNRSPESVYLSTLSESVSSKRGRKNSVKTQPHHQNPLSPAIIVGGTRGVRRLSNAMLTEIVRAAIQHKSKNSVSELGLLNQLVRNGFILKNINLITSTESIQDASALSGLNSNSASYTSLSNYTVVRRGNSNIDFSSIIMKHICSCELDSSVYSDC